MADVIEALILVVEIAAAGVRIPVVPAMKMDIRVIPTEGGPIVLTGPELKTS